MTKELTFKKGEVVYVSHPYGGKKSNKGDAGRILKELYAKYPGVVFISPLHSIALAYDAVPYDDGMFLCLRLLSVCTTILLTGNWTESHGCRLETMTAISWGLGLKELKQ